MTRTFLTRALACAFLLVAAATTAGAQTPAGTKINNTATARYSDANGNTYADVTASVEVTVGFKAGLTITTPATQSPIAGSTGNTIAATIANTGNGPDKFTLSYTAPAGVTVTKWTVNGTDYTTLADLNTALAAISVAGAVNGAAGGDVVVTLTYSVAVSNTGTNPWGFTATSVTTNTTNNTSTTNLTYATQAQIAVTPTAATSSRLPSDAPTRTYTQTFTLTNNGSAAGDFGVTVAFGGAIATATVSPASVTGLSNAAGSNTATVTVTYTVNSSAVVGATGTITVTATGTGTTPATVTATSTAHTVTVIRPNLAMTKTATVYQPDGTTLRAGGQPLPGDVVKYTITVNNTGTAPTATITVDDDLGALPVTFKAAAGTQNGFTVTQPTATSVRGVHAGLAVSGSASFEFTVTVK